MRAFLATFVTVLLKLTHAIGPQSMPAGRGPAGAAAGGRGAATGGTGGLEAALMGGSDFFQLGHLGSLAFSGGGMPAAMAYKMFDGSVTDFQKYKAKRALLGAVTGQGGAAAAGGGAAGGGGAGPGGILGRLAMGKLAAFSGGGMDPLTAYKMFDGSISDFQKFKLKKKVLGTMAGGQGGSVMSSALAVNMLGKSPKLKKKVLGTMAGGQGGSVMSSALAANMLDGPMADIAKINMVSKMLGGSGQRAGATGSASAAAGAASSSTLGVQAGAKPAGQGQGLLGGLASTFGRFHKMKMNNKLCEETPGILQRCGPARPCRSQYTKCTRGSKYSMMYGGPVCCAKNYAVAKMLENMGM